jgi:hypothetical protein
VKTNVRIRVREATAVAIRHLEEVTRLPHSRLIRSLLLGAPVVPATHLSLWQRLARSRANLTQLEGLIAAAPPYGEREEHLEHVRLAQEELRLLRRRLLGRPVSL